jgi:transglutaminase-like putative cysteine protease
MAWRLRVEHVSGFSYPGSVNASYNEARMTPMTLPHQMTLYSKVEVSPPVPSWQYHDYWGSQVTVFDLQRPHEQLRVTASSLVEVTDPAPIEPAGWPALHDPSIVDTHSELLAQTPRTRIDATLLAFAEQVAGGAGPREAARAIADWVRENVAYVPGSTGVQTSALQAWEQRQGVCQDIAHLTVGMLRALGIPARYVSGYLHPHTRAVADETVEGQSHAWVEWWCGGWEGYDPTNGIPTGQRHVVVARGRDYRDVTPLKGVYHGPPSSHLGITVRVTRLA